MITLQTIIHHPPKGHATLKKDKPKPCGNGNQPPCAIPLSDGLPLLALLAVISAIKKLKKLRK